MSLKIRFGVAVHGWLPITMTNGTASYSCICSHVLDDPVLALIHASLGFLAGTPRRLVLYEEPTVSHVCFVVQEPGDQLIIYQSANLQYRVAAPGAIAFCIEASRLTITRSVWRGLRELHSRIEREQYTQH